MSIQAATIDEHARRTIAERLRRVQEEISSTIENPAADPVHDLRVAIRRASQALRLFAGLLPPKEARRMRRGLKPALDAAGRARDLDVGAELLQSVGLEGHHPLFSAMAAERRKAVLALLGQLYLLQSEDVPLCWLPVLDRIAPSGEQAADAARAALPPIAAEFFEAGRKTMARTPSPEKLHALRLAAKRFRYTLELWEPFYGAAYKIKLESVRRIQSILGSRQDCAVMRERLKPLSAVDAALEAALRKVDARAAGLERQFHRYWHAQFDAPGEQERWMRYLARRLAARRAPASAGTPRVPIK
ncbi:MAG: CHAD domain-containing protein [Bryobacteraceae bacterium]|nr:CHAD domain-containing protein [Bryobacteraceae bacterium]